MSSQTPWGVRGAPSAHSSSSCLVGAGRHGGQDELTRVPAPPAGLWLPALLEGTALLQCWRGAHRLHICPQVCRHVEKVSPRRGVSPACPPPSAGAPAARTVMSGGGHDGGDCAWGVPEAGMVTSGGDRAWGSRRPGWSRLGVTMPGAFWRPGRSRLEVTVPGGPGTASSWGPSLGGGLWTRRGSVRVCSVAQGPAELSRRRRQVRAPAREPWLQLPGAGGLRALPAGACPGCVPLVRVSPLCTAHAPIHVSQPVHEPSTRMSRLRRSHPHPFDRYITTPTPACGSLASAPGGPPPRAGPVQPLGSRVRRGTEWTAPPEPGCLD